MPKNKSSNIIEMPDGTVRFLLSRVFDVVGDTGKLSEVAAKWAALAAIHPADALVVDNTPYEAAEFQIVYISPETDEEYQTRIDIEVENERRRVAEENRARDKAIRTKALSSRKLTEKQELKLLADLKAKYPDK